MTKDRKQLTLVICHKNLLVKCSGIIAQRYKKQAVWFCQSLLDCLIYMEYGYHTINPLNPRSAWHLISPWDITTESHSDVMRIKEMITNKRTFFIGKQILLVSILKMYKEQFGEYAYWC